ncbi:hypothetical protein HPP92_009579 [Vanilla planifolia]|uniref:Uncharacterized protein n=1 Tax=Vanilla planifolia TaxID=51239 RepID=A0A835REJ1_VANPL|nr:hypothetical protein HPP92_009579 [Vanilla planifolia]
MAYVLLPPTLAAAPRIQLHNARSISRPYLRLGRRSLAAIQVSLYDVPLFVLDMSTATAEVAIGGGAAYSPASYYTSLGLFVISVPGLWSLIKRSAKSKIVQKTFVREAAAPSQVAGEILSFFTRNNFTVSGRGETITFEGMMVPSRGQAALLTLCTCISLASVGLVLSIAVPEGGNNWFWLMALSPLA